MKKTELLATKNPEEKKKITTTLKTGCENLWTWQIKKTSAVLSSRIRHKTNFFFFLRHQTNFSQVLAGCWRCTCSQVPAGSIETKGWGYPVYASPVFRAKCSLNIVTIDRRNTNLAASLFNVTSVNTTLLIHDSKDKTASSLSRYQVLVSSREEPFCT